MKHKWMIEEEYNETIRDLWRTIPKNIDVNQQLQMMASNFNEWASTKFGNLSKDIKTMRLRLNACLERDDCPDRNEEINKLETSLEKLLFKEEAHWKQRSRNNWLANGDRNTAYFNKTATERRRRNYILHLLEPPPMS